MIDRTNLRTNYSGHVQLQLVVRDRTIPLSKIGPGYVVVRESVALPPCDAEIVMALDEREHRWLVELIDGAVPPNKLIVANSRL